MKQKDNYILQKIGDEHIIIPTSNEVTNLNGILVLNKTAVFIWEELKEERTREELINSVTLKFDTNPETASNDVNVFLEELFSKSMITE